VRIDEASLKAYIVAQLGGSGPGGKGQFWDLEGLGDAQLTNCIDDAIQCYTRWKPINHHLALVVPDGITKLTLTSTPVKLPAGTNGFVSISMVTNLAQGNPNIESQMLSGKFAFYGVRSPLYDLRFYEYQRQWIRFAQNELSSGFEWAFRLNEDDPAGPALWLASPGAATDVDVVLTIDHAKLATVPEWDGYRVKKLAMAAAKVVLGRMRSKYVEGFPAANRQVQLDGKILLDEGRAEWSEEEEHLKRSVADMAPIFA
jgi:hypothetical protein